MLSGVSICAGREHRIGSKSLLLAAGREDGRDLNRCSHLVTTSNESAKEIVAGHLWVQTAGEEIFRVTKLRA